MVGAGKTGLTGVDRVSVLELQVNLRLHKESLPRSMVCKLRLALDGVDWWFSTCRS